MTATTATSRKGCSRENRTARNPVTILRNHLHTSNFVIRSRKLSAQMQVWCLSFGFWFSTNLLDSLYTSSTGSNNTTTRHTPYCCCWFLFLFIRALCSYLLSVVSSLCISCSFC